MLSNELQVSESSFQSSAVSSCKVFRRGLMEKVFVLGSCALIATALVCPF